MPKSSSLSRSHSASSSTPRPLPSPTSSTTHINPNPNPNSNREPDSEIMSSPPDDDDKSRGIKRVRRHLTTEISTRRADVVLLVCCVVSGLVDSTIYNGMV